MKKHIANAIVSLFLFSCILNAATNDFVFYQVPASGPLTKKLVTPGTSKLLGFGSSASTPVVISLGSGLSLDTGTNTLTASGSGTVTSVALSAPSILSVAGSPVTTSGTIALSLAEQAANRVFAGPATGANAAPTFRALVAADIPSLSGVYQPLDSDLTALSSATAAGLALMDDADASAQRTTLGLGTLATQNGTIGNYAPLASPTFSGTVTMPSLGVVFPDGGGVIGMEFGGGLNKITLKTASLSGVKTVTIPATTGTIITTGDTGTVTNAMLAGSIDLTTKVTGTLPVVNGGTGITALGTGVATWLGTPTIANLNSAVSDADVAILAANTFTGTQTFSGIANFTNGNAIQVSGTTIIDSGKNLVNLTSIVGLDGDSTYIRWGASSDLILRRPAAATLQLGTNHATATTDQTIKAHDVTTGTGAALILEGGTGSVAGGAFIVKTAATTTYSEKLSVSAAGATTITGTLAAGSSNTVSGTNAIALGSDNTSSGSRSVALGQANTASGYSAVALGYSNTSAIGSGNYGNVAMGRQCYISTTSTSDGNIAAGFANSILNASLASFLSGSYAFGRHSTERLHGSGQWASQVPAQFGECALWTATTDATATEGFIDGTGGSKRFTLLAGQTYDVEIKIVGRKSDGTQSASYWRRVCIQRTGSTTALVGTVQTIGTDIEDDAAWDVTITADDTNDSLKITFTGAAATNIRWMARLDFTENNY